MLARVYADASFHPATRTAFWVAIIEYEDGPRHQVEGRVELVSGGAPGAETAALRGGIRSALRRAGVTAVEAFTDCEGIVRTATASALGVPSSVAFRLRWADKRNREDRAGAFVDHCDRAAYDAYRQAKRQLERPPKPRKKRRRRIDDRSKLWTAVPGGLRCPNCSRRRPCLAPPMCVGPRRAAA